ncbi:hypothetical protein MBOU_22500 [Mycobacterium bourgelatii]|uniref:Endopeptidase n=2 Tax=Mycobacterium bourgelatii TaxID=1273442 RepID=A0A7I9YNK4_MYCBU|nr:S1 family peptidase [Mycobacterium bourgelatii]GFG90208.1 hypothetical protein MBOU_22500 [Mycobacterium bourgelatii]
MGSQSVQARMAMLVVGAGLCLLVAAWPLLARRRGTRGTYSWRLSVVALFCAAGFVAAFWLPARLVKPVRPPVELPPASAIGPGTAIAVTYADGTGGMGCTAGFLVRTNAGETGVLTAGHCNKPGQASKVSMNAGSDIYPTVGTFNQTVSEGARGEDHDIGLVVLDPDKVPRTSAVTGSLPVNGVAADLRIGQQLCKFGMKTGQALCGQITDITESKVVFLAGSQCGDSGGPVYLIQDDGSVAAVGIHIRGGRPNDPNPGCSIPATFSVAELVRPWLDAWGLTLAVP